MGDTRYHPGDIVTVRDDLAVGERYYMDDGKTSDGFVAPMATLSGKQCEIKEVTKYGKYRLIGSYQNWTDGMFVPQEPQELPEPESLDAIYDFIIK